VQRSHEERVVVEESLPRLRDGVPARAQRIDEPGRGHTLSAFGGPRPSPVVFVNQGEGILLRELVKDGVAVLGPVTYLSPDPLGEVAGVVQPWVPRYWKRSLLTRAFSWAAFLAVCFARLCVTPRGALLFIVTKPPLAPLLGWTFRRLRGHRYVLLFYDIYPEALIRFGVIGAGSVLARAWRRWNRKVMREAEAVFTISEELKRTLQVYLPANGGGPGIEVVPTWVNTSRLRPLAKPENWFAREHDQVGKITILYAGNLGAVHDLSLVPVLAERLKDDPRISFILIGDGASRPMIEAECHRRALPNVRFLPWQAEDVVPYSLATADIGLVALAPGAEGISLPSKTYSMMAVGAALFGISAPESGLARVIREHRCGVNVKPADVDAAVKALRGLVSDPERLEAYRQAARAAAEQFFSRDVWIPRFLEHIRRLCTAPTAGGRS
jgi:glycosyltransferase involved in cell wall biosynthesis